MELFLAFYVPVPVAISGNLLPYRRSVPPFQSRIPLQRAPFRQVPMVRSLFPLLLSSLLLLIFVGCGVPYTEVGSRGGHKTVPIGNDQFDVTYLSNSSGGQPSNRMRELTLLRAAEVALEYGFSHFVVEDEIVDAQTKWTMKSTSTPMGGGISTGGSGISIRGSPGGGIGIGGSPGGGISVGGSPSSGIGIGSSGGMGTSSRRGVITSSAPVPVSIPELTLRIRGHHGVPSTAYQGELYDAARVRDILATQYGIDVGVENAPARPPPTVRVIE